MSTNQLPIIGISCGDLNGIGLEVVMKTLSNTQLLQLCTPVIFANSKAVSYHRKALEMTNFNFQVANSIDQVAPNKVWVINTWQEQVDLTYGEVNNTVGAYALKSIDAAVNACLANTIDAMVTAPINKNNIVLEGVKFAGHTGYIGQKAQAEPLMILANSNLRVAMVTGHIPLSEVANTISAERIETRLQQLQKSLQQDFGISKPKIAVLGLNPHAGDGGLLGKEEQEIITPTVKKCFDKGMLVYGPYAADGFFGAQTYTQFDAVLAMYHDQGLIPFKSLAFGNGVNYTAGLPIVRTSPDHGTAMEIAGKGTANEASFREAIYMAIDVVKKRKDFAEDNKNPLKKQRIEKHKERK